MTETTPFGSPELPLVKTGSLPCDPVSPEYLKPDKQGRRNDQAQYPPGKTRLFNCGTSLSSFSVPSGHGRSLGAA